MPGKYGSASVAITCDDGPGGTSRTITPYVTAINGIKLEAITETSTPFGQAYQSNLPTGVTKLDDITIEGFYDTTATVGPHVVFKTPDTDPNGGTRTFTFTPGDSKTMTVETYLKSYEVKTQTEKLSRYTAVLTPAPTSTPAWA